jgi:hypothetical protein
VQLTAPLEGWVQTPGLVELNACPFGAEQTPPQQSSAR